MSFSEHLTLLFLTKGLWVQFHSQLFRRALAAGQLFFRVFSTASLV